MKEIVHYKRSVRFTDADKQRVFITIECRKNNPHEKQWSFSGDCGSSFGQVKDTIKPATEAQGKLLELWDTYHLNGMSAGTPEQEKALKEHFKDTRYDYNKAVGYLRSINLYEVTYKNEPYKYGHGWICADIDHDEAESMIDEVIDTINEETDKANGRLITEDDIELFEDFTYAERCLAFAIALGLSVGEIDDIEDTDKVEREHGGVDYLFGTDEEMDEKWEEELDYYIDECVIPEMPKHLRAYFDDEAWKNDARIDGRGHSLNSYDGTEDCVKVNGKEWWWCRR